MDANARDVSTNQFGMPSIKNQKSKRPTTKNPAEAGFLKTLNFFQIKILLRRQKSKQIPPYNTASIASV